VVVNYAKDKSRAEKVVDHIMELGGKAIAVQADVSKPADVERLFKEAIRAFDKVDILIDNAGIYNVVMLEALRDLTDQYQHESIK
jgi:3-oxoacyl-[acyl-carrier protein] reductase